jgi:hypothetical protein
MKYWVVKFSVHYVINPELLGGKIIRVKRILKRVVLIVTVILAQGFEPYCSVFEPHR